VKNSVDFVMGVVAEIEALRGNVAGARQELESNLAKAEASFAPDAIEIAHARTVLGGFLVYWGETGEDVGAALQHLAPAYETLSRLDRRFLRMSVGQDYAAALIETRHADEAVAVLHAVLEQRLAMYPDENHAYVVWTRLQVAQAECLAGRPAHAMSSLDEMPKAMEENSSGRQAVACCSNDASPRQSMRSMKSPKPSPIRARSPDVATAASRRNCTPR
jgi:hypothetical protein